MFRLIWCSIIVVLLSSCIPQKVSYLTVGANLWVGDSSLFLAQHSELYEKNHIRVMEVPSGAHAVKGLADGTLDVASVTLDEMLTLLEHQYDLQVIWVTDASIGADALLVKPQIASLNNLKGKTISLEATAVGAVMLDAALTAAKLSVDDVIVQNCSIDAYVECYENADAIVIFEPRRSKLIAMGAVEVFNSKQIPDRIIDVLVARKEVIEQQPQQLKIMLQGLVSSVVELNSAKPDVIEKAAKSMRLNVADYLQSLEGVYLADRAFNRDMLEGSKPKLLATAQSLQKLMIKNGLMEKAANLQQLINSQFLPEH